ncbi:hypothetical protein ACQ4PT_026754 [Festuca glaucescens]
MAVALDALAPYVKKMIADFEEEELGMLLGVESEIRKLNSNLNYLTDADRKRITDKSVKAWVGKLKDVMYEATDILELCQLDAMERPQERPAGGGASSHSSSLGAYMKKKLQGCFQPLLFCLRNPVFAHETGSRIKKLNEELDTIRKDATKLNFINLSSYQERRKLTNLAHPRNKTTSGFNKSEAVGENIKENTEQLVQKLIAHDGRDFKVLAIVGQGGMGKSLLAKIIFATEVIEEEFKTKIWLSVTQHFDKVELLRSAINHAGRKHNEEKDESILERTLTEALSANKFLLVLDDVWSDTAWKDILKVPVANASCTRPGSRVLVTSRMEDAVRRMGASSGDLLRVRKLEDEDAWSLLKKQLPLPEASNEIAFDHLKDIGIKIIRKCDGLPLAIQVMGGLLSTRRPSELEWENVVKKNLEWKENGLHEELNFSQRPFKSLRIIALHGLTYCNQLPNGLCGMLHLEEMGIDFAPAIKLIGPDFQSLASRDGGAIVTSPFPKLRVLRMADLSRWKKWDWEEEQGKAMAMAMPALEHLMIKNCRLAHLPLGLASHNRYNLRTLDLEGLTVLASVENFPSVVTFQVFFCPKLKMIGGFSKLRKISIGSCPKLKLLEGVPMAL